MKKNALILLLALVVLALLTASTFLVANAATSDSFDGTIILGRPTNTEMTVSITPTNAYTIYVEWGSSRGSYMQKSTEVSATNVSPAVIVMDGLSPNKSYYYRVNYKTNGSSYYAQTKEYSFQMPRSIGSEYSFVIQSDSHLLNKADKTVYTQSMQTMASFKPDFMFDLGDTFLNDQVKTNPIYQEYETIRQHYTQQLPYFSIVASQAPLFLTLGNHEGEYGNFFDGTGKNLAVMATEARKTYYENPVPNDFYSGNTETEALDGQPEDYYAFTWGDALYVSIDPYRYTTADPYNIDSGWDWTLGKEQYDWFRKTLEESNAKYKFVFCHHAIGNTRGGLEVANLYEWGGYDRSDKYLFDEKRPGWGKPIQNVMEDTDVTIFFQGHDHLFARENVNGVIYQTLPKPAETVADQQSNDDAYPNADKLVNSGFLHVYVKNDCVQVDYYRNYCMLSDADQSAETGVVYSYTVDSSHNVSVLEGASEDFSNYGSNAANGKSNDSKKITIKNTTTENSKLTVLLNGELISFDAEPFIDVSGRTQVPVRFIAEKMCAQVHWNNANQMVTITKGDITIIISIGSKIAYINGIAKSLDTSCFIKDGRTYVPLRFISEALAATVNWDASKNQITITMKDASSSSSSSPVNSDTLYFGNSGGDDFTFDIQADSHLDENTEPSRYQKTLSSIAADKPAFLMDLGDTFMGEKLAKTYDETLQRYLLAKKYFDSLGSIPLFLVNGNHDGELGWDTKETPVWAVQLRKQYFPNPLLSIAGYTDPAQGNYYAFNYGKALFVVLDPFTFSTEKRKTDDDGWDCTLGKTQYDWLVQTLQKSDDKYKFVFIHNMVGGFSKDSRGGMEASKYFEWGGYNADGTYGFDTQRAGWVMPIHDLLVKYNVTEVFHGHDHFYAKQERDGIVYQLVPQPGTPGNSVNDASKFGYEDGVILPSAGYIHVTVSDEEVAVKYIKVEESGLSSIADSYSITP